MADNRGIIFQPSIADEYINQFNDVLFEIDKDLLFLLDFKWQSQKENLLSLVKESEVRLNSYEQIYPYIKELCRGQKINPNWYSHLEKVLNWVLDKGRTRSAVLSEELKSAWIIYIVLLSCSMIDIMENAKEKKIILTTGKGDFTYLKGSN